MSRGGNESRIYVGNLPPDIRNKDVEDLFYKFGKIVFVGKLLLLVMAAVIQFQVLNFAHIVKTITVKATTNLFLT